MAEESYMTLLNSNVYSVNKTYMIQYIQNQPEFRLQGKLNNEI